MARRPAPRRLWEGAASSFGSHPAVDAVRRPPRLLLDYPNEIDYAVTQVVTEEHPEWERVYNRRLTELDMLPAENRGSLGAREEREPRRGETRVVRKCTARREAGVRT